MARVQCQRDCEQRLLDDLEAFVSEGGRGRRERINRAGRTIVSMILVGALALSVLALSAPGTQAAAEPSVKLTCRGGPTFAAVVAWIWNTIPTTPDVINELRCIGSDVVTADPMRPWNAMGVRVIFVVGDVGTGLSSGYQVGGSVDFGTTFRYGDRLGLDGSGSAHLQIRAPEVAQPFPP